MSLRDMAICLGGSRKFLAEAIAVAAIPEDEFERIVEGPNPLHVLTVGRRRARKATEYTRRCPHCGVPLRIEDAR
jgi:hypothetical protein